MDGGDGLQRTRGGVGPRFLLAAPLVAVILAAVVVFVPRLWSPSAGSGVPRFDHVYLIVMQKRSYSDIVGNAKAPYINELIRSSGLATNYRRVADVSLLNYLAFLGARTYDIPYDCLPTQSSCQLTGITLIDRIEESGRSWAGYFGGMPKPCATADTDDYRVRHNPFLFYTRIAGDPTRCAAHVRPLAELAAAMKDPSSTPAFAFIVPDDCAGMRRCEVAKGDEWLRGQVQAITGSPAWTAGRSLLIITWDEGGAVGDQVVPAILVGPDVTSGGRSATLYSQYSIISTIEAAWSLSPVTANDGGALPMTDLLQR